MLKEHVQQEVSRQHLKRIKGRPDGTLGSLEAEEDENRHRRAPLLHATENRPVSWRERNVPLPSGRVLLIESVNCRVKPGS